MMRLWIKNIEGIEIDMRDKTLKASRKTDQNIISWLMNKRELKKKKQIVFFRLYWVNKDQDQDMFLIHMIKN